MGRRVFRDREFERGVWHWSRWSAFAVLLIEVVSEWFLARCASLWCASLWCVNGALECRFLSTTCRL